MKDWDLFKNSTKRWWKDRFVTLMVIPERTRQVHRIVVPFFMVKFSVVMTCLLGILLIVAGVDYIHVLGRIAENKKLKGENFKLRQEMQVIRNKVEQMESTVERVRNYAKKLQILTGQGNKAAGLGELPMGPLDESGGDREPAAKMPKPSRRSELVRPPTEDSGMQLPSSNHGLSMGERVEKLERVSLSAETNLSQLQGYLLTQRDIAAATPSLLPIHGWLSSSFGYRRHPNEGNYRFHAGLDIAAEPGTPVRAPADGLVIFSGFKEGYGKVIVIDHGYGIHTIYGHNSELFSNAGDRIKRGEVLSKVGSTGRSTGPHLHYEVRKFGKPVDPMYFIGHRF